MAIHKKTVLCRNRVWSDGDKIPKKHGKGGCFQGTVENMGPGVGGKRRQWNVKPSDPWKARNRGTAKTNPREGRVDFGGGKSDTAVERRADIRLGRRELLRERTFDTGSAESARGETGKLSQTTSK